ncbi:hypothetical protein TraAM80_03881 [Trypanosoma rangeli]|uniref:TOG domain-containing protein n=1 Tax=Trypanosoma rangeli TaxID=5698 RepID=A0A422NLS9_TRYRA|nr:uncharacterized protein TraAM80_03881 [Trypanosoma rangeli]RNF06415.1 hypothetical protein TraAM80_03881 [Trypanosoma rangeli]|eukprot:RNF06415.1 hypothetical protein TraAM80_03881 [Trypanosoma rangeli]
MNVSTLLQRQLELHGALRRPPQTVGQLQEVHRVMKELLSFFQSVRSTASELGSSPETVFQCLMHIGMGDVLSFDRQRRDGAVPMHQAKVLSRTNAIKLEPRLRTAVPADALDSMVALSKTTRTLLRIKVEDGNDFSIAEDALRQSIEYLDYIDTVSRNVPEIMFKFYMVEDEASLLTLLGHGGSKKLRGPSENGAFTEIMTALPRDEDLEKEICQQADVCASTTESAGNRVNALRTINCWINGMDEDQFLHHILHVASHLSGPLSVCAAEKRSAVCRQACNALVSIAKRTPARFYHEGPLKAALTRWCSVLVRGIFVTVSAIARATHAALRALVVGSGGNAAMLKCILDSLESAAHPELRRKCLGYLVLGVVASQGKVCALCPGLAAVSVKYMEIGDSASRKMGRTLYITLVHFGGVSNVMVNRKSESLIRQEKVELSAVLDDVEAVDEILFGANLERRRSTVLSVRRDTAHFNTPTASSATKAERQKRASPVTGDIYDTSVCLRAPNTLREGVQPTRLPTVFSRENSNRMKMSAGGQLQPLLQLDNDTLPTQPTQPKDVKLSVSLRRKIEEASSLPALRH